MFLTNSAVQTFLNTKGTPLVADGDWGPRSRAALNAYIQKHLPALATASDQRKRIAVEQAAMADAGVYQGVVDGLTGPATKIAVERWQDILTFKLPGHGVTERLRTGGPGRPVAPAWPLQRDVKKFFGKPGENQVRLTSPYPLFLDWDLDTKIMGFQCHEMIHDPALRVMKRVLDHYGPATISELHLDHFGGCLNVRKMRNGQAWSMHAWGIAIDWDADRNQLRWSADRAYLARPKYQKFLDLWEEEGFVSLGRARNMDWMHVQAARLG
jgi:peptidoglycan hydrolase-like protein with peptidoglycan-binding domain